MINPREIAHHIHSRALRILARECLWRGETDEMYYRNVDLPTSTLRQWQTMIESSRRGVSKKFLKYFILLSARRFAKTPVDVYHVATRTSIIRNSRAFVKSSVLELESAPNPRADWLSAIVICRSISHPRIILGMYLHPFRLSISPRLLHFPYPFCIFLPRFTLSTNRWTNHH